MPQMAPNNWLILFFMFSLIFLAYNIMNYWSYEIKMKSYAPMNKKNWNSKTWKW